VYLNGSHLSPADFTATNGSDVVLGVAASADDVCDIISYTPFEVADATFTGDFKVDGTTFNVDSSNNRIGVGTASPASDLHLVSSTSGDPEIRIEGSGTANGIITFLGSGHTNPAVGLRYISSGDSVGHLAFFANGTSSSTLSERFRISADGSLSTPTAGTSNFRAGVNAGNSILSGGNYNVVVGDDAGTALTTGDQNVAIGFQASKNQTTSARNTVVGNQAAYGNLTGAENVYIGYGSGPNGVVNATADSSVAVGAFSLTALTTGDNNTAIGYKTGLAVTTGVGNSITGANAGLALSSGNYNTAVGLQALSTETVGAASTAIGAGALQRQILGNTNDSNNVGVGYVAGTKVTTGTNNVLLGRAAYNVTTGNDNIAIGTNSLSTESTGQRGIAIGTNALATQNFTGGQTTYNVAIGYNAGQSITTGETNTLIGGLCCDSMQTNEEMTAVGYNLAATSQTGRAREIVIGSNGTGGGSNTARFITSGGSATLNIDGSDTSWAAASDSRLKKEVANSTVGLEFIKDLRPVTFKWNAKNAIANSLPQYDADSSDPVYGEGKAHHGFIAQEVKTVIDAHSDVVNGHNIWVEDPNGTQQVAPSALVPMLVKAIQEQNALIEALTARITTLEG
jgi:hypothetical protein